MQLISIQLTSFIAAFPGLLRVAEVSIPTAFRASSQQAAAMAVTALWQGAAIACAMAICLRLAPRTSAAHRFAVWAAAFITLVTLPVLALISNLPSAAIAAVSAQVPQAASRPWLSIDARWSLLIAALWAAATLLRAADLAIHSFRLHSLWKNAVPVETEIRINSMLASASSRGPIELCTTTTLQRPSVIGFFKPRILIPNWLFARLTPGELEQIVLHEAEHLRRCDDWTNLFQKLCLVLFPLNPGLLFIERRLCREREMACDDGVIRVTHAPRAYAACLASLAERGLQHRAEALSLGAWQRRPELANRVHSILRRKHTLGLFGTRALLGALGCSLLVGSFELARCPQLVAFVPARNLAPVQPPAQPLNAAYAPVHLAVAHSASYGFQPSAIASPRPANHEPKLQPVSVPLPRTGLNQQAALEWKTAYSASAPSTLRPGMLKAEIPGHEPVLPRQQQQQWIVLTTWEQLQTPNASAGLNADYDTGASPTDIAHGGNLQPSAQPASQIIVTRFIFRIDPATFSSSQHASAPLRSGWFVIQL